MTAATPGRSSTAALATVAMSVPWRSAIARSVRSSAWNSVPAAEIVDDQLVLGQRAVLEVGRVGSGTPSQRSLRNPPATVP